MQPFPCLGHALASPALKLRNKSSDTWVPDQSSAAPLCWKLLTTGSRQLQGQHSCSFPAIFHGEAWCRTRHWRMMVSFKGKALPS